MTGTPQLSKGATEVEELARTLRREDLDITARCYAVEGGRGPRFEVLIEGAGERAVVDIPGSDRPRLEKLVEVAVDAFAAAAALRIGRVTPGHVVGER